MSATITPFGATLVALSMRSSIPSAVGTALTGSGKVDPGEYEIAGSTRDAVDVEASVDRLDARGCRRAGGGRLDQPPVHGRLGRLLGGCHVDRGDGRLGRRHADAAQSPAPGHLGVRELIRLRADVVGACAAVGAFARVVVGAFASVGAAAATSGGASLRCSRGACGWVSSISHQAVQGWSGINDRPGGRTGGVFPA